MWRQAHESQRMAEHSAKVAADAAQAAIAQLQAQLAEAEGKRSSISSELAMLQGALKEMGKQLADSHSYDRLARHSPRCTVCVCDWYLSWWLLFAGNTRTCRNGFLWCHRSWTQQTKG